MRPLRPLFWASAFALAYTYLLFPLLLLARAALRPRSFVAADITPSVTIVVAAHNEARGIGAKLENLLSLDYARDCLEVVVASDGSDDGTNEILRRYADGGVRPLLLPRRGKSEALNAAVAIAGGEIIVFTDANSIFESGALRALVAPFADPTVGGVAGNQVYLEGGERDGSAIGERRYWNVDRMLKEAQSRAGSVTGATGAIYAIRRELFRPVPPGLNDDFITSLRVIEQGRRLVFARDAVAYEAVSKSREVEFERKVRVMTRGLHCTLAIPALLDPRRHGFYSIQLVSHKLLMRSMAAPLAVAAVSAPLLWRRGSIYRVATVLQGLFYSLAAVGLAFSRTGLGRQRLVALPAYFCFMMAASVRAWWNVVRGRRVDRWEPQRDGAPDVAAAGGQLHDVPRTVASR